MFKAILVVIILFILMESSWSQEDRGIAKICANYEKVSNIMIPYMDQAWPGVSMTPTGPVPTVTMFTLSARQPILDFCAFATQLKSLNRNEAIFATANYGNKLLDNQHTEKIDFMRDTYDLGVALNTFNQGNRDVSQAQSLHRRINAYLKTSDRMINGDNAKTFETRQERERKMTVLIQSSNKIAIYKKAMSCPAPNIEESEKNMEYFEKEIVPLYPLIEEKQEEVAYFLSQLQYFGTLISPTYEAHQAYQKELYDLFGKGVIYQKSNPKTKSVKTSSNGSQISRLKITYFTYSAALSPALYSTFSKNYSKQWAFYINSQIRAKGLLANPSSVTAKQFRDTAFECRRSKIEWNIRRANPIYQYEQAGSSKFETEVTRKIDECKKGVVINDKRVENLFNFYVNELKTSMMSYKTLTARVWSYDSEYLGMNRNVTLGVSDSDLGEITQEEVKCEQNLNATETEDLKNRLEAETLNSRAMMAEELTKKTMLMEAEAKAEANEQEKARRESAVKAEEEKRKQDPSDLFSKPSTDISF